MNKISFAQFRSNALQSLSLLKDKDKKYFAAMSKDDLEKWVKEQWVKHYIIERL